MSNPNDLVKPSSRREVLLFEQAYVKPSSRREVLLFEQAYDKGFDDMYAAMRASLRREVWRIKHPVRYAFHRFATWLRGYLAHPVDTRVKVDERG